MVKISSCPFCDKTINAPDLTVGSPFYTAVARDMKEISPENADALCQENFVAFLPEVEYEMLCPQCGRKIQVNVLDIDLQCSQSNEGVNLLKINDFKTYQVIKPENPNLRETRGLREFLNGSEANEAQYFLKVTHGTHLHAFCSRCGGSVMITFHGLGPQQEAFELTCRHCGKYGVFNREPRDFEDKPLIINTRKNP